MSEIYNEATERFWEKIEFHRSELDLEEVDLKKPFLYDQLIEKSPLIKKLKEEVEEEFNGYAISEHQLSWAIWQAKTGNLKEYNKDNKLSLKVRE